MRIMSLTFAGTATEHRTKMSAFLRESLGLAAVEHQLSIRCSSAMRPATAFDLLSLGGGLSSAGGTLIAARQAFATDPRSSP